MNLLWDEMIANAVAFSKRWKNGWDEKSEAQSFVRDFLAVFGVDDPAAVGRFEERAQRGGGRGFMDYFWPKRIAIEMKSKGKDLSDAYDQLSDYIIHLPSEDMPELLMVSDFETLVLWHRTTAEKWTFKTKDLRKHVKKFAILAGYEESRVYDDRAEVNVRAAEKMARLHDALKDHGYGGHELEVYLVRILFCLFADDTDIFQKGSFTHYIENAKPDGSDLSERVGRLFEILDMTDDMRAKRPLLPQELLQFRCVNGGLFADHLHLAEFDADMRRILLDCALFDWNKISPAIFGAMFQGIMDKDQRRELGAHYTSERDILKLIRPLFLDGLRKEFETVRHDRRRLDAFHRKLGSLKFLDPACGCGNFLVITYRELRLLELDVLEALNPDGQLVTDIALLSRVDVDQFFGIELEEWPARIAETALWLMDHQMNQVMSDRFGRHFIRLPLKKSARIFHGNALRMNWREYVNPAEIFCVLGNPPFAGAKYQNAEQRMDMASVAGDVKNAGLLDYVAGWYFKAADFIQGTDIRVGFVSTNSISQGEQPGILWNALFAKGMKIIFAYRTFAWESEARGKAHVHVVIIGFAQTFDGVKRIYGEDMAAGSEVKNISPYLTDGPDTAIVNRVKPICDVPPILFGNQPIDGGNLLLNENDYHALSAECPEIRPLLRPFIGSEEFLHAVKRWCLWLEDADMRLLRRHPAIAARIEAVKAFRLASKRAVTQKLAATPTLFAFTSHPDAPYLLIPSVSSEKRKYIPIGFMQPDVIASNLNLIIPGATLYHFGILTSAMHMAWMRQVCGRLKSDYRYSGRLVYNNFPWPQLDFGDFYPTVPREEALYAREAASRTYWSSLHGEGEWPDGPKPARLASDPQTADGKKAAAVEDAALAVLEARANDPVLTMAELYDPVFMPPALTKAHAALDRAVDRCYRAAPFTSDRQRVEFLFALYESLTAPLLPAAEKPRKKKKT